MALFKKAAPVVAYTAPKTVASITEGLSGTLAELKAHAKEQTAQAAFQKSMAEQALVAAAEHERESGLADKVAGNIEALLGTDTQGDKPDGS